MVKRWVLFAGLFVASNGVLANSGVMEERLSQSSKNGLHQNYELSGLDSREREILRSLASYLQQANTIIHKAQAHQREEQRIKFRYDWLEQDLRKIVYSIQDHLNQPERQPREFEPVSGDYRR
ncbi:RAQPRD family integrative conjugative element protein [Thiomicrorhabdus indica]|uniref:integrative conjugative element protein, RAQPRD family n=1 Tax=Thiomicrorhabdus indica TaxID=2267253 RepID=UPI001981CE7C|nr:RAQPRD family integrative conjugative element protein [Thiomicrorhabdus indica]